MIEVNEQDVTDNVITRQALGRHGSIGSLYDIRDEEILSQIVFDEKQILIEDYTSKRSFIDRHRSEKETWNKLNIESSMQLSLQVGLIRDIPKYLERTIVDNQTVRVTFVFLLTTKRQYIPENSFEQTLDYSNATHYISGIIRGKQIFLTFESISTNSKAENELITVLEKTTIQNDEIHFEDLSNFETWRIVLTDGLSTEILSKFDQDLIQSTFNRFIANNNDQQVQFELHPLKTYFSNIDSSAYQLISNEIDKMHEDKLRLNKYLEKINVWKDWIPFNWRTMPSKLINEKQSQMKVLLKKVRSGEKITSVSLAPIEFQTEEIDFKIKILSEFNTNMKQPNATILLKNLSSIDNLISNYYDHQIYLLHISNQWIKQDPINWSKQLRCFLQLQETDEKFAVNKPIFRVIDHDLHTHITDRPNSCTIYHANRGTIVSQDFFRTTSLSKLYA